MQSTRPVPRWNYWQREMAAVPTVEVENSIVFRVLVGALVIVGIIATDVAAQTQFSFWGVPLSLVGAIWSCYRRSQRNISVKFCIAIGMLLALFAFFGRLVGELNDTRLVLAELLIQLQVLHSFDMPRRKDLGYSIVIGLILLGVAATLSQTLAFAPVLVLFLALALPTLVLDYRSRLGLGVKGKKLLTAPKLSALIPFYFLLFTAVLALGMTFFVFLPRFPGYQLRTFPVSSPIQVKGTFTGQKIVNPGYVHAGNPNPATSSPGQRRTGKQVDNNFYYGFNSEINQNLRGQMIPLVVMRVRSQSPGFWRVLAFDQYTGQGWKISRSEKVQTLKRPAWSYQIFINPPPAAATKEVVQTYSIVSDLPNLIPALASPKEIYFPTPQIAIDPEGGLRSPVGLTEDLTYTVISEVPYRRRSLLQTAPTNYPPSIQNYYLQVPPQIAEKVKLLTQRILENYNRERIGKSQKALTSPYEQSLYLAQYLKQHYTIPRQELPELGKNDDLVESFLFKSLGGYPDHFSTVLTVMLRSIGIPSRLVAGFSTGDFNPFTGLYIVRNTDAYAMTEVYFPNYGWFAFDPIPQHPLIPDSVEDTQTFSVLRSFWHWVAGWLPSPVTGLLNSLLAMIGQLIQLVVRFFGLFFQGWLGILTGLIISAFLSFGGYLGWRQWREWLSRRRLRRLPPMECLYQQMLLMTAKQGFGKHPAQTPLEYARLAFEYYSPATGAVIERITRAYVGWRYGGEVPNLGELRREWGGVKRGGR